MLGFSILDLDCGFRLVYSVLFCFVCMPELIQLKCTKDNWLIWWMNSTITIGIEKYKCEREGGYIDEKYIIKANKTNFIIHSSISSTSLYNILSDSPIIRLVRNVSVSSYFTLH